MYLLGEYRRMVGTLAYALTKIDHDKHLIESKKWLDEIIGNKQIHIFPEITNLFAYRALVHLLNGQIDLSEQDIVEADQLNNQFRQIRVQHVIFRIKAQLALYKGELESAANLIDQSLEFDIMDDDERGIAWRIKGNILCQLREWEQAEIIYKKCLQYFTTNVYEQAQTRITLGNLYVEQNKYQNAQIEWEQAREIFKQIKLDAKENSVTALLKTIPPSSKNQD